MEPKTEILIVSIDDIQYVNIVNGVRTVVKKPAPSLDEVEQKIKSLGFTVENKLSNIQTFIVTGGSLDDLKTGMGEGYICSRSGQRTLDK